MYSILPEYKAIHYACSRKSYFIENRKFFKGSWELHLAEAFASNHLISQPSHDSSMEIIQESMEQVVDGFSCKVDKIHLSLHG